MPSFFGKVIVACVSVCGIATEVQLCAQIPQFDGVVQDPQGVAGMDALIGIGKGASIEGQLVEVIPSRAGQKDARFLSVSVKGRSRKLKVASISSLSLGGKPFKIEMHHPSGQAYLVDLNAATAAADQRLSKVNAKRSRTLSPGEFETLSEKGRQFAKDALAKFGGSNSVNLVEGKSVFLITDYPAKQRIQMIRSFDQFTAKLNQLFGFDAAEHVLPGKPLIGAFAQRSHLATFQTEVAKNPNFGTIRAFFHIMDGNVVVTAEDDRSPNHMMWQAAWGLSGAYSHFSYSDLPLPAWFRVGLQQHCADSLVRGVTNFAQERKDVLNELQTGSLNGILSAENLPGNRQIVCKSLVGHLFKVRSAAVSQMLAMMKMGQTSEQALQTAMGMRPANLASSFGRTFGMPSLKP